MVTLFFIIPLLLIQMPGIEKVGETILRPFQFILDHKWQRKKLRLANSSLADFYLRSVSQPSIDLKLTKSSLSSSSFLAWAMDAISISSRLLLITLLIITHSCTTFFVLSSRSSSKYSLSSTVTVLGATDWSQIFRDYTAWGDAILTATFKSEVKICATKINMQNLTLQKPHFSRRYRHPELSHKCIIVIMKNFARKGVMKWRVSGRTSQAWHGWPTSTRPSRVQPVKINALGFPTLLASWGGEHHAG